MATMMEKDLDRCPVCDVAGLDLCTEEAGQTCLDHWGRPADLPGSTDRAALVPVQLQAVA